MTNSQGGPADNGKSQGLPARSAGTYGWRGTKWLVVIAWVIFAVAISPFAERLSGLEQNDPSAWLPQDAESLRVHQVEEQFPGGDSLPAVVVYHRPGGLTPVDLEQIDTDLLYLDQAFPSIIIGSAVYSEDGETAFYVVPLSYDENLILDHVADIRDHVSRDEGLIVKVTGPAGGLADAASVFDGIDSTLLMASALVVTVLLLFIYRSPFLWLIPLLVVGFAHQTASGAIYGIATQFGVTLNGQNLGILPVLVFGVGTDYALLLIARYREELRRYEDKHDAMTCALRQAGPAIIASAGTTILGLMCLLAADLTSTRGLGPIGAIGIFSAFLAMLTLLPAVLLIFGRRLFWPFVPLYGTASGETSGVWSRIGNVISNRPRPVWVGTLVVLAVFALGVTGLNTHLPEEDSFRQEPESVAGQKLIASSFPAGAGRPATVMADVNSAERVETAIMETPGVAGVERVGQHGGFVAYSVTLDARPGSQGAFDTIDRLRDGLHSIAGANALVGGPDATEMDVARANARDRMVVIPLALAVVLVILTLLLRAAVAPLIMTITTVLSFAAALGVSVVVFEHVFNFAGVDDSILLLSFVFLVTLGVDYNIFLMSRVREESALLGTRDGTLKGLAVTGGVITSAGLVLAATFAVVGVLPLVAMNQLGFIVAFGILLETLVVRSVLLPALNFELDDRVWWPSRRRRSEGATSTQAMLKSP
ncbi:MAG: MMPL family transporter [Dehalococcoidia bacterium]